MESIVVIDTTSTAAPSVTVAAKERPPRFEEREILVNRVDQPSLVRMRKAWKDNASKLVFRRIGRVIVKPEDRRGTFRHTVDMNGYPCVQPDTFEGASQKEKDQYMEAKASKFFFFTSAKPVRGESDCAQGEEIYGASGTYSQLDTINFRFSYDKVSRTTDIVPRIGDLVCGLVARDRTGANPSFRFWFLCSEQFLRAWTLITYPKHETLIKLAEGDDEDILRRKMMGGNHLRTNSHLAWLYGHQQCNLPVDPAKSLERCWALRTELASRGWCHIYAAIALMLHYGELPCPNNVPTTGGSEPALSAWSLPEGWQEAFYAEYNITATPEWTTITVPIKRPPQSPVEAATPEASAPSQPTETPSETPTESK